jgi:hypothetical protein
MTEVQKNRGTKDKRTEGQRDRDRGTEGQRNTKTKELKDKETNIEIKDRGIKGKKEKDRHQVRERGIER